MAFRAASALLAACMLSAVAAQQNCPSNCVLTQCPCYSAQVDNVNYARPPGCVAQVPPSHVICHIILPHTCQFDSISCYHDKTACVWS